VRYLDEIPAPLARFHSLKNFIVSRFDYKTLEVAGTHSGILEEGFCGCLWVFFLDASGKGTHTEGGDFGFFVGFMIL
jgi:hypothetical protein